MVTSRPNALCGDQAPRAGLQDRSAPWGQDALPQDALPKCALPIGRAACLYAAETSVTLHSEGGLLIFSK